MLDELQEHVESIDMANGKGILDLESGSSSSSFSDVLFGAIWTFCFAIFHFMVARICSSRMSLTLSSPVEP